MKQHFLLIALFVGIGSACVAQNVENGTKKRVVPKALQNALIKSFPGSSGIKWDKDDKNYEAEFKQNGRTMSAAFTSEGVLIETEVAIKTSELPAPALKYVKEHYKSASIREASKITKPSGEINYEAEVNKTDIIFSADGNFRKEEKD